MYSVAYINCMSYCSRLFDCLLFYVCDFETIDQCGLLHLSNRSPISTLVHMRMFCPLLSCQPIVTVTLCFVYKDIRDLSSIDHLCINPILRIGLIHK